MGCQGGAAGINSSDGTPQTMKGNDTKARFDDVARRVLAAREDLQLLTSTHSRPDDKKALESIMTDLSWAAENCTVLGLHKIGQALDDHMGL